MNTPFDEYCKRQQAKWGDKFSPPTGDALIRAYNNGPEFRVQVDNDRGDGKIWGFVRLTSGWRPSFMLMRRVGQHGSSYLLNASDTIYATRWMRS